MKNGLKHSKTSWLVVIAGLFCWTANANINKSDVEVASEWKVEYLANGKTRFEARHGDALHYYEIKLTAISIDGKPIELAEPKITIENNQVTKQWLPYLKETWIDVQSYNMWSFEVARFADLPESTQRITLTYDVESDGIGGMTVGDHTSILFDLDVLGKQIHQPRSHEELSERQLYSVSLLSSRCMDAKGIAGYPEKNKTVVFDLSKQDFPLFTQGHVTKQIRHVSERAESGPSWYLSKLSENNQLIQLIVPVEKRVGEQLIDTYDVFQMKKPKTGSVVSDQKSKLPMIMEKVTEEELFGYIRLKPYWHPISVDVNQSIEWLTDKNIDTDYTTKIQSVLTGFGNRAFDIRFGKKIVIDGDYMYVIDDGSDVNIITIYKNEESEWVIQEPIVIAKEAVDSNPLNVYMDIKEVVVDGDLMIVAMDVLGHRVPSSAVEIQSSGEVRIYRNNNNEWVLEKILTPEFGNSEDRFGEVVAVGKDVVVVSAYEFKSGESSNLNGVVYIFNYKSGQWQKPLVIKPTSNARSDSFYHHQGFGSQLQLVGNDLYIKASSQGYSSNNTSGTSVACPYFDSFGVIYHYRKVGNQWKLLYQLKSKDYSSHLVGPMLADAEGLYFLSSDSYTNTSPEIYIKRYSKGQIIWQQRLSNLTESKKLQ